MAVFQFSPRPNRANEIHWREWGQDAFQEASVQDKPILLGISAVWCHWCHVMDETTYSDPGVIETINAGFVPVRVDNDQRPDVNRRYNLGGWPTTAFLTPEGELIAGGTYVPPQQMRAYLYEVTETFRKDRDKLAEKLRELSDRREAAQRARDRSGGKLSAEIFGRVAREVLDHFDPVHGGFGEELKFPHTDALELALAKYYLDRDENYLNVVSLTLTQMASGGLYDQVAGGFFRYSTSRDWSEPHFEKMLEENSQLLTLLLHAYQVTGRALLEQTARSLIGWVRGTLFDDKQGYFYGSQDADEHYYKLTAQDRARLPTPYVDRNLYADWNAQMASALLLASRVLRDPDLQTLALRALGTLGEEMYQANAGLFHFRRAGERQPQLPGQLSDATYTARAYLDAFEVTGRRTYLTRSRILAEWALEHLLDRELGGLFGEEPQRDAPGLLRVTDKPIVENAVMADTLRKLAYLSGEDRYRQAAEEILGYFAGEFERYSYTAAGYALAVRGLLGEPAQVTVVGAESDSLAHELLDSALRAYAPFKSVELVDPIRDSVRLRALAYPATAEGALAYVCIGRTCLPPVQEPTQVAANLARLRNDP